jgi:hypothetical protein
MRSSIKAVIALAVLVAGINQTWGQKAITIPLDGLNKQRPLNVKTEVETYKGLTLFELLTLHRQTLLTEFSSSCWTTPTFETAQSKSN